MLSGFSVDDVGTPSSVVGKSLISTFPLFPLFPLLLPFPLVGSSTAVPLKTTGDGALVVTGFEFRLVLTGLGGGSSCCCKEWHF